MAATPIDAGRTLAAQAVSAFEGGDFDAAARLFGEAYRVDPQLDYLQSEGQALEKGGRMQQALSLYAAFLEAADEAHPSWSKVARLRAGLASTEARRTAAENAPGDPDPWARYRGALPEDDPRAETAKIGHATALRARARRSLDADALAAAKRDLEAAQKLSADPVDGYWAGVLAEKQGDKAQAQTEWRAFLAVAPKHRRAGDAQAGLTRVAPAPNIRVHVAPTPVPEPEASAMSTWGWVSMGVGLAALGGGVASAWLASDAHDTAEARVQQARLEGEQTQITLASIRGHDDRADNWQTASFVGYGLGAALLGVGGALLLLDDGSTEVALTPGGVLIGLTF